METTAPFDLNQAIQQWRESLSQSPAFRGENLDELESHLRDSVMSLKAHELNDEEAFLVAIRRLGRMNTLEQEFGKVNVATVWRDRALWMLAGMLFYLVGWNMTTFIAAALRYSGGMVTQNGILLGWLSGGGSIAMLGLVVFGFWKLAKGDFADVRSHSRWLACRPAFAILAMLGLNLMPGLFNMLSVRSVSPLVIGQSLVIAAWFHAAATMIITVAIIAAFSRLLINYARRHSGKRAAARALVLPFAILLTVASASAQTNHTTTPASGVARQSPATLDQAIALWQGGKKDAAVAKFLAVDFSKRPLFTFGSVLNYTEAQFMALPQAAREKLSKQMLDDISVIKAISAEVKTTGKTALNAGDKVRSDQCTTKLRQCGEAFDQPDSLALLKLVGKALKKMAAAPVGAGK
ncbi:MAG TPA: permease prefix domain 1-containing protein [Candidatus Paceibacterota bacterium]|nr:permease prefix domain 1-containing protein [Candidatus Paceibacterota bacterium]